MCVYVFMYGMHVCMCVYMYVVIVVVTLVVQSFQSDFFSTMFPYILNNNIDFYIKGFIAEKKM